jgi:hypothetical protein
VTTPYAAAASKESSKATASKQERGDSKQERGDSKQEEAQSDKGDKKHSKDELLADASGHDRDNDDRHHISP